MIEPFGYFRCNVNGWEDCAETDEGAIALYEHPHHSEDKLDMVMTDDVRLTDDEAYLLEALAVIHKCEAKKAGVQSEQYPSESTNNWKIELWPEPVKNGMQVGIPKGVKVTHIPTCLVETCNTVRGMHANREKALQKLGMRLVMGDS